MSAAPEQQAVAADAARHLTGLLDDWRAKYTDVPVGQEVVHAQLFSRLLAAHGVVVDPAHRTRQQRFAAWRGKWLNHLARLLVGGNVTQLGEIGRMFARLTDAHARRMAALGLAD